jgi:hypothetical protein
MARKPNVKWENTLNIPSTKRGSTASKLIVVEEYA